MFAKARSLVCGPLLKSWCKSQLRINIRRKLRPVRQRFKGRHSLHRYENGLEKCIGCSLVFGGLPVDAIFVEFAENTDDERYSPGERYARVYEINMLRCSSAAIAKMPVQPRPLCWATIMRCRSWIAATLSMISRC